jgi:hypothetical protein
MTRIRVDHDLMFYADPVQKPIKLLDRSLWDGLIAVSKQAKHRGLEVVKLVKQLLHLAPVEGAYGLDGSPNAKRKRHPAAEAETNAAHAAIAEMVLAQHIEDSRNLIRGPRTVFCEESGGCLRVSESRKFAVIEIGRKRKIAQTSETVGNRPGLRVQPPPLLNHKDGRPWGAS